MTLDEFRATGRDVADLSSIEHIACSGIESGAGRVYLDDTLFIERDTLPYWSLTIGNWNGRYSNLAEAERKLYEFAVSEGYVDDESAELDARGRDSVDRGEMAACLRGGDPS